jgi:hypothetical protein
MCELPIKLFPSYIQTICLFRILNKKNIYIFFFNTNNITSKVATRGTKAWCLSASFDISLSILYSNKLKKYIMILLNNIGFLQKENFSQFISIPIFCFIKSLYTKGIFLVKFRMVSVWNKVYGSSIFRFSFMIPFNIFPKQWPTNAFMNDFI